MIIELLGTPGAGKTTLLPVISSHLNQRGFQAFPVLDAARPIAQRTALGKLSARILPKRLQRPVLWQVFYLYSYLLRKRFAKNHRTLMKTVLAHQQSRPITSADLEHVLHWFMHLTGYYQFFGKYSEPSDALIFDEGFVHRVVQLFASENEAPNFGLVSEYLHLIPQPDLVVFMNAPEDVCKERVFSRGVWDRFRDKDPEDTLKFIANANKIVNFSANYLRQQGWCLIEVENGEQDLSLAQKSLNGSLTGLDLEKYYG